MEVLVVEVVELSAVEVDVDECKLGTSEEERVPNISKKWKGNVPGNKRKQKNDQQKREFGMEKCTESK